MPEPKLHQADWQSISGWMLAKLMRAQEEVEKHGREEARDCLKECLNHRKQS